MLNADAAKVHGTEPAGTDGLLQLGFEADGRVHALRLRPNRALGVLGEKLAGQAQAYEGDVGGYAGSWAAVTRIGGRWSGIWYDGGEYFGVDSAAALAGASDAAAALPPDTAVVYRLRDMVWEEPPLEDDTLPVPANGAQLAAQIGTSLLQPGAPTHQLAVAVVADAQLADRDGAMVEANLLARLNIVDGLFAHQLGVRITASSVTVFEDHDDEPFSGTNNPSALLQEISDWRFRSAAQRSAGITFMFTGRNLQGRTVGMAYMDSVCGRRYAAALSQATGTMTFAALVAAHEIGHVFGAPHDGEGACATTPTDFIMAPRINGSQSFSTCSLDLMAVRARAASCLAALPPPDPVPGTSGQPPQQQGGGGAPDGATLVLLLLLALARAQMRANQSAR